jgi:hypothetical protein
VKGIERSGDQRVEELLKGRQAGVRIGQDEMVMVRHDAIGVEPDAVSVGGQGEEVHEDLVSHLGWPQ